jgi:hypothetical protein
MKRKSNKHFWNLKYDVGTGEINDGGCQNEGDIRGVDGLCQYKLEL